MDLVLLDIAMPGMDGITTLKEIKRIDPALKTVMLTGNGISDELVEAFNLGAHGYLTKPLDLKYLRQQEVICKLVQ